jgi:hypothetical protein
MSLRDSSKLADRTVSSPAGSVAKYAAPQIETRTAVIKADPQEIEEFKDAYGFCPSCASPSIRRAYRHELWEESSPAAIGKRLYIPDSRSGIVSPAG